VECQRWSSIPEVRDRSSNHRSSQALEQGLMKDDIREVLAEGCRYLQQDGKGLE
jgi:hypothetical protein